MRYISTRNPKPVSFREVITKAGRDGGLYVPEFIPRINWTESDLEYKEVAFRVTRLFIDQDELSDTDLRSCVVGLPKPVLIDDKFLELFHGPTMSFKDVGMHFLSRLFPILFPEGIHQIIVCTSGDTGAAAAHAFSDQPRFPCTIYYPKDGVSKVQLEQMTLDKPEHIKAVAIDGSFDDAQKIVKKELMKKGDSSKLAVNSINWARMLIQISYYVYASMNYGCKSFAVPTGNFGNALSAYYAKRMEAPINYILVVTNENNAAHELLQGCYNPKACRRTLSSAMDICIPSNFERLQFESKRDTKKLDNYFKSNWIKTGKSLVWMRLLWRYGEYMMDPHTAIAYSASREGEEIVVCTASPKKFENAILTALGYRDFKLWKKSCE